jgi:TPR repeat protein
LAQSFEKANEWRGAFFCHCLNGVLNESSHSVYKVAMCKLWGLRATRLSLTTGVTLLTWASLHGEDLATSLLGNCYWNGDGVTSDRTKAGRIYHLTLVLNCSHWHTFDSLSNI